MSVFPLTQAIREAKPLIHCVTNFVTANDCANLLLAVGASPVMACALEEAAEIAGSAAAVVLNTGTPTEERFRVCFRCAQAGRNIVLDPVGVGASPWRLGWVRRLLEAFTPAVLRLNCAEALALLHGAQTERGVDSGVAADPARRRDAALALAERYHTAVLLSGPVDMITAGGVLREVEGGSPRLAEITGSGCMLSALCAAFAAVSPSPLEAAVQAAAFWRACASRAAEAIGPGSFRAALLDAAYALSREIMHP